MKYLEVVAGIIEKDGLILCTQRNKGKYPYMDYKWEFAGGKVEKGETKEQALVREIKEELGIDIEVISFADCVLHNYPDFPIKLYFYNCKASNIDINLNVHKGYKWLKISELSALDWALADRPMVNKLMEQENLKTLSNN